MSDSSLLTPCYFQLQESNYSNDDVQNIISNNTKPESHPMIPDLSEEDLMEMARVFLGVRRGELGSYRWIVFNETLLTTVDKWIKRPYFCPYKRLDTKWILTCKSDLQGVSKLQRVHLAV